MNEHPRTLNRPHLGRIEHGAIAAGANMAWTPDPRQHIELLSLRIDFSTDGNVANRLMLPAIGPILENDFGFPCPVLQVANRTYVYYWGRDVGCFWVANFANYWCGPLPSGLLFQAAEQLHTDIQNIQAGDQITAYTIRYQAWQDPALI